MDNYIPRGARAVMRRELAEAKVRAAQEGRMQGMLEGMQQGIQQGMQQGQAALLALQLTQRFGTLPEDIAALLATATPRQLQDWAMAVINTPTLNQIFARH